MRPCCSSIATSQIEITEMRRLPSDSALRMASSAVRESFWVSPNWAHNQQCVSSSKSSLGIRRPFDIDGLNDIADYFHGAFHAPDEAFRVLI